MNEKLQRLAYLLDCINRLSDLIHDAGLNCSLSRAQAERLGYWKRARRALHHDLKQLEQTIPGGVQLQLVSTLPYHTGAAHWHLAQFDAFGRESTNDPLNGEVDERSTPSDMVR